MVFSDSSTKEGLVQSFEFWTRMKDGSVTGTLLKQVTSRINRGFDKLMPLIMSYSDYIRWDDLNHTDQPIGYVDIASGTPDYKVTEDDNSLDILNITRVRILKSASATKYEELERIHIDHELALKAMSPDSSETGTPTHFLEVGNRVYLHPKPNYAVSSGIELFFEREQSYFLSTDTTKEAGIPKPFHELLVLHAALDWNRVNRTTDRGLIVELQAEIQRQEKNLYDLISMRNPTRNRMTVSTDSIHRNQSGRLSFNNANSNR